MGAPAQAVQRRPIDEPILRRAFGTTRPALATHSFWLFEVLSAAAVAALCSSFPGLIQALFGLGALLAGIVFLFLWKLLFAWIHKHDNRGLISVRAAIEYMIGDSLIRTRSGNASRGTVVLLATEEFCDVRGPSRDPMRLLGSGRLGLFGLADLNGSEGKTIRRMNIGAYASFEHLCVSEVSIHTLWSRRSR